VQKETSNLSLSHAFILNVSLFILASAKNPAMFFSKTTHLKMN